MHDVNCWLLALSFAAGLLLTFAMTVRRVKGEVPVAAGYGAGTAAVGAATTAAERAPTAHLVGGASEGDTATMAVGPYGAGSVTAGAGGSGPAGWTIKGNEDSMLYHTLDSPWYGQTIAEVWFREESAAQAAGFTRWDKGKAHGHTAKFAAAAEVPPGPYGAGSAKAGAGGGGPAGWTIKGNEDSMLYHGPDSPAYDATIAEVWFRDEKTAQAAGFKRWDSWKKKK